MRYKRIEDSMQVIYFTEQAEIFRTDVEHEDELRKMIEEKTVTKEVEKYEFDPNRRKLRKLIMLLTSGCNLRCRYCYLNYGNYNQEERIQNLDVAKAKQAIDELFERYEEGIGFIQFFGGEPLLAFKELKEIYNYIKAQCEQRNIDLPKFGMVTNGTILNQEIIDFLNEAHVSVTMSIDGDQQIHDIVRKKADYTDTYVSIKKNLVAYRSQIHFPLFYEMTLNREHVLAYEPGKLRTWVESIKAMGFDAGIIGVVEFSKDPTLNFQEGDEATLKEMYKELVDYYFEELMKEKPTIYNMDICKIILNILKKDLKEYCCATGVEQLTLSANGVYYPCPKFADVDKKVGIVGNNVIDQACMQQLIEEDKKEKCQTCWMKNMCTTYCYALKYRNKEGCKVIPIRCMHVEMVLENVVRNIVKYKQNDSLDKIINNAQLLLKSL